MILLFGVFLANNENHSSPYNEHSNLDLCGTRGPLLPFEQEMLGSILSALIHLVSVSV